ncbi:hypothetical protein AAFF_G00441210 [Aldrovandia affinis]|uniref:Uncharacterized protein n=1 Tax=Aldrovandia affinis TaxID=143900 RepID=A0AAD7WHL8_9TELE|nr:hypothetical protein AAFF_G00441210 [Aldrovandia affinis]
MERYALIFGVNTFGAMVLQTVLTAVVVDGRGLGLDIVPQVGTPFIIYGGYFSTIAALFLLRGVYTQVRGCSARAHDSPAGGESACPKTDTCPGHKL